MKLQLHRARFLLLGSVGMMAAGAASAQSGAGPDTPPNQPVQTLRDGVSQSPSPAANAEPAVEISSGEIVVSARKRSETAIDVPVALVAISQADLARYGTRDLVSLATQVPGLIIQPVQTGAGGSIVLRGVTSTNTNPAADQAISFNVDGVQVSSANMMRLGILDLQQIEILKGPQALFFGKNSPGGVISIRTADPGDRLEATAIAGYEFNARERTLQLGVGGPVTDTLGVRLVAYGMQMDGYRRNLATDIFGPAGQIAFAPAHSREPHRKEGMLRGTVLFKPSPDLTVRAKYTYNKLSGSSPFNTAERIACPYGLPQTGSAGALAQLDDCKIDDKYYLGAMDPRVLARFPQVFPVDGARSEQQLGSLDISYNLARDITLSSVTGYYKMSDGYFGNSTYQPASLLLISIKTARPHEISQEVRLATSRADWPVNFTVGGFYQDAKFTNNPFVVIFNAPNVPANLNTGNYINEYYQNTKAYSFFGQAIWKITPNLELAGGARYSSETKDLNLFQTLQKVGGLPTDLIRTHVALAADHLKFTDTSPEVTLTWKPQRNLTIFGGFRNGFKSGGFNTGAGGGPGADLSYKQETARGGEFGIKAIIGPLRFNATTYNYTYKNMQVSTFNPNTGSQTVVNAAAAKIRGIEADATYRPYGIDGLELRGAFNYNHARYSDFLVGCYNGQTIADGCNLNPNPVTSAFRQQNFKGRQLMLAPDWTGTAGFTYSTRVSSNLKLSVGGDTNYSSSFSSQLEQAPLAKQNDYWMFNANVRVGDEQGRWELALLGQNLTEVYRSRFVSQVPGTGIGARTGTALVGGLSDLSGQVNRGREIRLQLTAKFD